MLVFLDEAGDPGLKVAQGSSTYFTVAMVVFEENDEAQRTDDRIALLRTELGLPERFEFHFTENNDRIRRAFFEAVLPYNWFYYGFVINKAKLYGPGFQFKDPFYKYVCGLVFENAKPHLDNAIVKIDRCGSRDFQNQLSKYLRTKTNTKKKRKTAAEEDAEQIRHIKKVAAQDSSGNNLLQLADMVCGAVMRSYRGKPGDDTFRKIIQAREISVRFWPPS